MLFQIGHSVRWVDVPLKCCRIGSISHLLGSLRLLCYLGVGFVYHSLLSLSVAIILVHR